MTKPELNIKHRSELWKLIKTQNERPVVVEVGVAEGRHLLEILKWPNMPIVHAVDRWQTAKVKGDSSMTQDWHDKNYAQVFEIQRAFGAERVRIHEGASSIISENFDDESVDLVYIDADHSYDGVRRDINAWFYVLRTGGIMAFHDYENPSYGVQKAVIEFAAKFNLEVHKIPENKLEDAGAWFRKV